MVLVQLAPHVTLEGAETIEPEPVPSRVTATLTREPEIVSSSPAPLSSEKDSTAPAGAEATAVKLNSAVPEPEMTSASTVKVTLLPAGMVAVVLTAPVPVAAAQLAPDCAEHVHVRLLSCGGRLVTIGALVAVDGPALRTVTDHVPC